jgi:hypothetical protein
MRAEFAHATRPMTLDELTASIAHEVLHDESRWHGNWAVHLPFDYRSAWRADMGLTKQRARSGFLFRLARNSDEAGMNRRLP